MIHLITELSKYVMIILFAIYTWYSYVVLAVRNEERQKRMYKTQTTCMYLIHLDAFMVLFAVTKELKVLIFYGAQVLFVLFLFLTCHLCTFASGKIHDLLKFSAFYWCNTVIDMFSIL